MNKLLKTALLCQTALDYNSCYVVAGNTMGKAGVPPATFWERTQLQAGRLLYPHFYPDL